MDLGRGLAVGVQGSRVTGRWRLKWWLGILRSVGAGSLSSRWLRWPNALLLILGPGLLELVPLSCNYLTESVLL